MKRLRKVMAVLLAVAMIAALAACTGGEPEESGTPAPTDGEHYTIGIIQQMEHVALDGAREGFVAALADKGLVEGQNLTINYQNGNGDPNNLSTIAEQFVSDNVDLALAIATTAAQTMASKTETIPIIGTAITSYTETGLVDDESAPGGNVTGTTDMNPVESQMELMFEICPDVKTVGFLYCNAEDNSRLQVDIAKAWLDGKGIAYVERTVSSTNDVQQAVSAIVTECDAIYLPTDNVFATTMPTVYEVATPAGIPTFCGEVGMVENGGFATLSLTYYAIGYQAGLMAYEILVNGADPATMPIKGASEFEYCFNGDVADELKLAVPDKYADYVIRPSES
ncbi:MAG: ABC transporter substrate-binding protein [Oscillospiraceae bacterium]|nr:ABC transporter substrate-binding protein [Oscillospiraceae bacterium]